MKMDTVSFVEIFSVWQILLITSGYCDVTSEDESFTEYCQNTVFNATCAPDEVVLMTSALYGRMRIGTCVEYDLGGFVGCKTDVLDITDQKCSGHRTCEINVPNGDLDDKVINDPNSPCLKEVKSYLEAAYICIKALVVDKSQCTKPIIVKVYPHSGVISSPLLTSTGCGHSKAPWILEALPGQVLNISLIDFNWQRGPHQRNTGMQYGRIIDLKTDELVTIKGGRERMKDLYVSKGHKVQIVFHAKRSLNPSFVIKYHAVGCPDLNAPKEGWLQRKGSELVIGCNATRQTWHLQCEGNHWTGVIGNCSISGAAMAILQRNNAGPLNMPHGLAIFIVAAVSVLISCTIILIGVICMRRFNGRMPTYNRSATMHTYKQYPRHKDSNAPMQTNSRLPKNDYMHIWDQPLPEPLAEEYQHPTDMHQERPDSEITNMKIIRDEMSRGLENYTRKGDMSEETRAPPKEDKTSGVNKIDMGAKLEPRNLFIARKECENPDCVCFVGYEPSCSAHSLSQ